MTIQLTAEQSHWIEAQVKAGRFSSVEEAVAAAVARLQTEESLDESWAETLVAEALAQLDRGDHTPWREGAALEVIHVKHAPR